MHSVNDLIKLVETHPMQETLSLKVEFNANTGCYYIHWLENKIAIPIIRLYVKDPLNYPNETRLYNFLAMMKESQNNEN